MKLEHSFTVPTGIDEAWRILLDIERIGPCMPGAAIDTVDGDDFTGTVKVKLGPIGLTYKGKASFIEKDDAAHRAVIDARGRDSRGNGTAAAKVTAVLADQGGSTLVTVDTDLDITGKPAQFGRGVMVDVGNKLIGQFADNLSATITSGDAEPEPPTPAEAAATVGPIERAAVEAVATGPGYSAPAEPATAEPTAPAPTSATGTHTGTSGARPSVPARDVEPINLIESAGPAVIKRLAPLAAVLAVLLFVLRRRAQR